MAFPRTFKAQTWFVRLSTGEIESATARELERSFNCGLVDSRTQVRAVGTHVWTTLGKAAEIKDGPTGSLSSAASLSPVAIDEQEEAPPQTDGDVPWHVRNRNMAAPPRKGIGRPVASMIAVAAIGCMVAVAMRFSGSSGIDFTTRSQAMLQNASEPVATAPTPMPTVTVLRESEQASPRDAERWAKQEIRYLRELLDYARRMRGDDKPRPGRLTSRTPVTPPPPVRPSFIRSEPAPRPTNPHDPLNGIL